MPEILQRYKSLKELVVERKTPFNKLMDYLEVETDWLKAPASSRFHLSQEQGLLEHSVSVAETMLMLKNTLAPDITDESDLLGISTKFIYLVQKDESTSQSYDMLIWKDNLSKMCIEDCPKFIVNRIKSL